MRNLLLVLFLLISIHGYSQTFTVRELLELPDLSEKKRDNLFEKNEYVRDAAYYQGAGDDYRFRSPLKKNGQLIDSVQRAFINCSFSKTARFTYSTSSSQESETVKQDLRRLGFLAGNSSELGEFYQHHDELVAYRESMEDSVSYYQYTFIRLKIPNPDTCVYADDLLGFDSHEMLAAAFGDKAVQKDNYYFSANQLQKCSVLFPNSSRQAIFIWEDEKNNRKLSHILIGGTLRAESSMNFNQTIRQNTWQLRNGLRTGLGLTELLELNQKDFSFFGYGSEYPGIVIPENGGAVNFKKTGVILSCLNCYDTSTLMDQETIDAKDALENSKRLFVKAIIVLPDPKVK